MSDDKSKRPSGILRLDIGKPRRSSGGSVEFRNQPELHKEHSPQSPSNTLSPQLSVTWAFPSQECKTSPKSEQTLLSAQPLEKLGLRKLRIEGIGSIGSCGASTSERIYSGTSFMEKPTSPLEILDIPEHHDSDVEDYSVSVSAIMQRRASTRGTRRRGYKSPRRASSPMGHMIGIGNFNERRRSSVYTTSSGDTAISFDDGTQDSTQEQIFENIRLHKEVLQSVKMQPWSMRRKLRLVRQAKEYVVKHEGALQEKFAKSRSTKDMLTRFRIVLTTYLLQRWQHFRREILNISTVLIPWEHRIKEIESHFGSVVASYFTFLRWLFWVNIVIAVVLIAFVVTPEMLVFDPNTCDSRKSMLKEEQEIASNLITIWDFEGYLKYSPLFYGYYSESLVEERLGYRLPLAYFLTGLTVYIYSFVATLRKMAENSRMSKLSSKDDECVFTWKLFTGWDFMIGHAETAHNRVASVVLGFKEALLEEAEKKKDKRNWKVICLRIFVNLIVLCLLGVSAAAVILVVSRSIDPVESQSSWWRRNEITIVMSLISYFFPMFFEALGLLESYHPRQQLRRQLARIMLLNLLNLYSLIFALFDKITGMTYELQEIRRQVTLEQWYVGNSSRYNSTFIEIMKDDRFWNDSLNTTPITPTDFTTPVMTTIMDLTSQWLTEYTTNLFDYDSYTTDSSMTTGDGCIEIEIDCEAPNQINGTLASSIAVIKYISDRIALVINQTTPLFIDSSAEEYDEFLTTLSSNLNDFNTSPSPDFNFSTFDPYQYYNNENETAIETNGNETELERLKREIRMWEDWNENDENRAEESYYDYLSRLNANYIDLSDNTTININGTLNITDLIDTSISELIANFTSTPFDVYSETDESTTEYFRQMFMSTMQTITEQVPISTTRQVCYNISCPPNTTDEVIIEMTTELITTTQSTTTTTMTTTTTTELMTTTQDPLVIAFRGYNKEELLKMNRSGFLEAWNLTTQNYSRGAQSKLRKLCWETMFGQELVKLTVMDLVITITSILFLDFFRALFVRFMNKFWCWDLEKTYPKYGDFKIAENILHLVNNQGMVWMGMFFSPGLALLNLIKLVIVLYVRSWAVLTCNVPHEVVFRASRSNNFYLALLLTMLFLCVLPVAFAIVWLEPSWHCGPFANYPRIYYLFIQTLKDGLPGNVYDTLKYFASPSTVIPLLVLLILIIYYLISLTNALREANQDLKMQLRRERTEERRKMFKIVENNPSSENQNAPNTISARWKKVLENTSPLTPSGAALPEIEDGKSQARKELLARIMKKALRKGSGTSEDDSNLILADDATDTENHESLPHDYEHKKVQRRRKIKKPANPWLALVRSAAEKEIEAENGEHSTTDIKKSSVTSHAVEKHKHKKENNHAAVVKKIDPNFIIVDEKAKKNSEPEVFKFDDVMMKLQVEQEIKKCKDSEVKAEDDDYLSDDMSSYREIILVPKNEEIKAPTVEAHDVKVLDPDEKSKIDEDETKEKKSTLPKDFMKGKKKLNSFLALVREAVQNKKSENSAESPEQESPSPSFKDPSLHKVFPKPSDVRRNSKKPPTDRAAKRQDSVSSIWSEQIPVITISKTLSDECILDGEEKQPKQKKKRQSKEKIENEKILK